MTNERDKAKADALAALQAETARKMRELAFNAPTAPRIVTPAI